MDFEVDLTSAWFCWGKLTFRAEIAPARKVLRAGDYSGKAGWTLNFLPLTNEVFFEIAA